MEFQFLIPIFGIIFGTVLTGVIFWKLIDLVKTWINRNNSSYDEETFERMAQAFIKHKKETEKRLENLEAIVTDDEPGDTRRSLNKPDSSNAIEMEDTRNRSQSGEEEDGGGNLPNMLNKKRTS